MVEYYPRRSSVSIGLACACPRCGEGKLYGGILALREKCDRCGLDYSGLDSQDGAAFFIIFAFSAVIIPLAVWFEFAFHPPLWVHVLIWGPVVLAGSIALLRPLKAFLIAQQYRYMHDHAGSKG